MHVWNNLIPPKGTVSYNGKRTGIDRLGFKILASQGVLVVKDLSANAGDIRNASSVPGLGRSLEKGMATHSSILAWRIPRTEEPGGLQSMWLRRVGHN